MSGLFGPKIKPTLPTFGKTEPRLPVVTPAGKPITEPAKPSQPVPPASPSGSSQGSSIPTGGTTVRGLDVSHYEPVMDYTKAYAEGFRFVFAKATDGSGGTDSKYAYHRANAKAATMIFGSFHFIRLLKMPAKEQAAVFRKAVGDFTGELIACDLEWCNEDGKGGRYADGKEMDDAAADFALEFLTEVERLFGMTPVLYTHHYFFRGFKNPERFARFPVWLTQPNVDISKVVIPAPWKRWAFWQNSFHQKGLAPQNPDGIDSDLFQGTLDELKAMTKHG